MFDPVIAPSGTLLGLLQRGRGDGTLHALAAPRAEALAALNHCVLNDPRHDWQVGEPLALLRAAPSGSGRRSRRDRGPPSPARGPPRHRGVTDRSRAVRTRSPRLLRQTRCPAAAPAVRGSRCQLVLGTRRTRAAGRRQRAALARRPGSRQVPGHPAGRRGAGLRRARRVRAPPLAALGRRSAPSGRGPHPGGRRTGILRPMATADCDPAAHVPGWSLQAVFDWAQQALERGSLAACAGRPLSHRGRRPR